jgi:GTP-binding protein
MPSQPKFDAQELEDGRRLFAQACRFVAGAAEAARAPATDMPEIAFAGRSNAGKSSLINALTSRKALARAARAPGRTREINFFDLSGRLMLADLPGYGFARAAKAEVERWTAQVEAYLASRRPLARVLLLIDGRRGILGRDEPVLDLLDATATPYQIVLTKCDKVKTADLQSLVADIEAVFPAHPACHPQIIATSSRKGTGIPELRAHIAKLASDSKLM